MRPKDLEECPCDVLACCDCMTHYSADPLDYEWLPSAVILTCVGCGAELVPLKLEDRAA